MLLDSNFRERGSRISDFGIGKTDQRSGFPAGVQLIGSSGPENDNI
jgi:hypothetical protein